MAGTNNIRRGIIDVQLAGSAQSSWDPLVAAWCHETLLPAIEKALEKYAHIEQVIPLDKISIDVKTQQSSLGKNLVDEIVQSLEKEVEKQWLQVKTTGCDTGEKKTDRFAETLFFFLQHGFLPWWSDLKSAEDFRKQWWQSGITALTPVQKHLLHLVLKTNGAAERLISLQPDTIFFSVFASDALSLSSVKNYFAALDLLAGLLPAEDRNHFSRIVKKSVLEKYARNTGFLLPEDLAKVAGQILFYKFGLSLEQFAGQLKNHMLHPFAVQTIHLLRGETKELETVPATPADQKITALVQQEKSEGIFIGNAGLVLIASYLPVFFKSTGIAGEEGLNSADLAIAILQWMATGNDDYAEFETVLPKVLCGLEPEENIAILDSIPVLFKTEATELLESVIAHWEVLKQTTVDGLRASFLLRDGKLSFRENHWLLQVEQKPYDMLLEHLPWSIGIIKLPWMKQFLRTEWM